MCPLELVHGSPWAPGYSGLYVLSALTHHDQIKVSLQLIEPKAKYMGCLYLSSISRMNLNCLIYALLNFIEFSMKNVISHTGIINNLNLVLPPYFDV